ncbi:hypothetical protein ES703_29951 [subsurface metagenome]
MFILDWRGKQEENKGHDAEEEPPPGLWEDICTEITVAQGLYSLLSGTLSKGLVLNSRKTTLILQEELLRVYGIEVTRRHIARILKAWRHQGVLIEHRGRDRSPPSAYHHAERVVSLARPGEILRVKKWKRGVTGTRGAAMSKGPSGADRK